MARGKEGQGRFCAKRSTPDCVNPRRSKTVVDDRPVLAEITAAERQLAAQRLRGEPSSGELIESAVERRR